DVEPDAAASVRVQDRKADAVTFAYQAKSPQLLRVAIASYPGWHATLNGTELPLRKVDRAFMGVVVPPGQGEVRLAYSPRYFWQAAAVSALAVLASVVVLASALPWSLRALQPARSGARARLATFSHDH